MPRPWSSRSPIHSTKVRALTNVAKALPASERGRKQALLERATTLLRDRLQQANAGRRLRLVSADRRAMAGHGRARSCPARASEAGRSRSTSTRPVFLANWRGSSPIRPWHGCRSYRRSTAIPSTATMSWPRSLSSSRPIIRPRPSRSSICGRAVRSRTSASSDALRLCRRLARVDPPRARRVAASLGGPGARACAWAFVALGLAEKDKAGASEAMDRAIEEIDRLRESGPGPEPVTMLGGIRMMYPTNPAAVILPVVERIAPERLAEVFWRAVALHPRIETDREDQLSSSYIGFECMLLARYDREVAAALFEPMDSYLRSLAARAAPRDEFDLSVITAKACIDPRAAVELLESLTPPRGSSTIEPGSSGAAQAGRSAGHAVRKPMEAGLALESSARRLTEPCGKTELYETLERLAQGTLRFPVGAEPIGARGGSRAAGAADSVSRSLRASTIALASIF